MFYKHFYLFIWLCVIFGIGKTTVSLKGTINKPTMVIKLWPLLVIIAIIVFNVFTINGLDDFSIRQDLEQISCLNDAITNVFIIFTNSVDAGKSVNALYDIMQSTINILKIENKSLTLISKKINIFVFLVIVVYILLLTGEILSVSPPFIFLTRIPMILAILHLSIHLYLILTILKVINQNLSDMLSNKKLVTPVIATRTKFVQYLIDPDIKFIRSNNQSNFVDTLACKIYDNLCTSLQLLHNIHGAQVLLSIWLMFSNAVISVTLIACHQGNPKWLVIAKGITPFAWCLMGCYIADRLFRETEQTEILIMKNIIDYRCDPSKRSILETFKQLVSTNRLQFIACSIFELNYSMVLGTVMNVITYSIILIQLFLNKETNPSSMQKCEVPN